MIKVVANINWNSLVNGATQFIIWMMSQSQSIVLFRNLCIRITMSRLEI